MTIQEADKILRDFYKKSNPSDGDQFLYTEALDFLIDETKDPEYMNELGAFYYEQKQFDLALKYYELAAEAGNLYATSNLGYIWYYGRAGEKNYEKAFYYFDKAAKMGDLVSAYKVADMYKNGYYVEKDYEKYKSIIEELYDKIKNPRALDEPLPEIYTRLARIRAGEGETDEALNLYDVARDFLSQRIQAHPFFGDLNIMKWMINDIYKLREFNSHLLRFYDLYYLFNSPCTVKFTYNGADHEVEAAMEGGDLSVRFDSKWYHNVDDFFMEAEIGGELLTALYEELYDFSLV